MMIKRVFTRRWLLTTVLVIAACGVMVRLGFWQLDRLGQRRALNARILAQVDSPPLILDAAFVDGQAAELTGMEFRQVAVTGEYDFSQQVALRNKAYLNRIGVHLVTPLRIKDSEMAIWVDRGWIPQEDADPANWDKYDQLGEVSVQGVLMISQTEQVLNLQPDPTLAPGETRLDTWNYIDLARLDEQTRLPLLPMFIQQVPEEGQADFPMPQAPDVEITEGPHLGYAIQWFMFASILFVGYPFYARSQEAKQAEKQGDDGS